MREIAWAVWTTRTHDDGTKRPARAYEVVFHACLGPNLDVQLIDNPDFPKLCARLGLARYWRETGAWPDCAGETPYDFKAACGAGA